MCKKIFLWIISIIIFIFFVGIFLVNTLGITFFIRQDTPEQAIVLQKRCDKDSISYLITDEQAGVAGVNPKIGSSETIILTKGNGGWYIVPYYFQSLQKTFLSKNPPSSSSVTVFQVEGKTIIVILAVMSISTNETISDNINSDFVDNIFKGMGGKGITYLLSLDKLPEDYELYVNGETIKVN